MNSKVVQKNLYNYRKRVALEHKLYNLHKGSYNGSGIVTLFASEIITVIIFLFGLIAIYTFGRKNNYVIGVVSALTIGSVTWLWKSISRDYQKEIIEVIYELDCLGLDGKGIANRILKKVKKEGRFPKRLLTWIKKQYHS